MPSVTAAMAVKTPACRYLQLTVETTRSLFRRAMKRKPCHNGPLAAGGKLGGGRLKLPSACPRGGAGPSSVPEANGVVWSGPGASLGFFIGLRLLFLLLFA